MGAAAAIESFAHWSSQGDTWRDRPVLVLEHAALMRRLLTGALKNAGARTIITAGSEAEAKTIIASDMPGMVVADWRADQTDHRQALSLVKSVRTSDNLAIRDVPIVLTGQYTSRTDIERARDSGASEFLKKPLSTGDFLKRIEYAAVPRLFIKKTRYAGPDRRRKPRDGRDPAFKRKIDVQEGLVDSLTAARNACVALAHEVARDGCQHARRVAISLNRYLGAVREFGPTENEIVEMHRAALVQLEQARDANDAIRISVVQGLEDVVKMRLSRL
ncbi:response regulator [Hyphobacterium sp.]|uniref:response regulator n=1 Tax=Hyphobacterium sp. TaxID=2004662 RepID=UPI003749138E